MKKITLIIILTALISCKKEATASHEISTPKSQLELGKELFENKGACVACHLKDQKVIGPSIVEIAKIYKAQNADMVAFLKEDAKPIVDPSQYEVMKTNFAITKNMSDEELKAIEAYIYSHLQ